MVAETIVSAQSGQGSAGTATVATVVEVGGRPLSQMTQLKLRLEFTTAAIGTTPTLDLYIQRATQPSPTDDDWQDFYHFPQHTTALQDLEIDLSLPPPQDVDGSLGSASRAVVQESLAADTLLSGGWGDQIRIREVVGGTITTQAVYNIHAVGR